MEKKQFGRTAQGAATLYAIANTKGMRVLVTDFGATLVSIFVKDKNGADTDVILGYEDAAEYEKQTCYFGATVGRNCNRISDAKIMIDDTQYILDANDNENNLHSGANGLSERIWEVKEYQENKITLTAEDADMQQGFPGNAAVAVTYEVTEENGLKITYHATADKKTLFNFTNHSYFNLNGEGTAMDHVLQIKASHYTPVKSEKAIPTGEIASVEGTPFDFRTPKIIGQDIDADNEQLRYGNGYDHNYAIDKEQAWKRVQAFTVRRPAYEWMSARIVSESSFTLQISSADRREKAVWFMTTVTHSVWKHSISRIPSMSQTLPPRLQRQEKHTIQKRYIHSV